MMEIASEITTIIREMTGERAQIAREITEILLPREILPRATARD